jgi:hypothetical protein
MKVKQVMIKLSDKQQVNAYEIKQVWVSKGEGCRGKWWTHVKLYNWMEQYNVCHDTRDAAMQELDSIHDKARAKGIYIGIRDWMYDNE